MKYLSELHALNVFVVKYQTEHFKKIFIFSALAFLMQFKIQAQLPCGTDAIHQQKIKSDPLYRQAMDQLQKQYRKALNDPDLHTRWTNNCTDTFYIPVVFHILHLGEPIGTGTNISDAQCQSAIDGVNEKWGNISGNGADVRIRFCIARRDPAGNPTTGINRINAGSMVPGYAAEGVKYGNSAAGVDEAVLKDLSKWPVNMYYNVWVVNSIQGGWAGYAFFPNGGPYDGTIVLASQVTKGSSTLTHEFGHGWSLPHTFEGDNTNANCPPDNDCTVDGDGVCDTPPHKQSDCGATNPCSATGNWDNSRFNYMSYCGSTDRFTLGQTVKIRSAAVGSARGPLLQSEGCIPADAPTEAGIFSIDAPGTFPVCYDSTSIVVVVKNYGTGPISSIQMQLIVDGGAPIPYTWTGSIAPNITKKITFPLLKNITIGKHVYTASILGVNGVNDAYVNNNMICGEFIYAGDDTNLNDCENFEGGIPANMGTTRDSDFPVESFTNTGCPGKQGTKAIRFSTWDPTVSGATTYFYLPRTHLKSLPPGTTGMYLQFDVAKRKPFQPIQYSTLEVLVSDDCGQTFKSVYAKNDAVNSGPNVLHTVPAPATQPTTPFEPTDCSQWKTDYAELTPYIGKEVTILFRLTLNSNSADPLYLDNFCYGYCDYIMNTVPDSGVTEICLGDTLTLKANASNDVSYQWYRNSVPLSPGMDSLLDIFSASNYFVYVKERGCTFKSDTITIKTNIKPNPSLSGSTILCEGTENTIAVKEVFNHYLWSNNDTTQSTVVNTAGTYTVTVTNDKGCTAAISSTQIFHAKPVPVIIADLDFCSGDSAQVTVSDFFSKYNWDDGATTKLNYFSTGGIHAITVTDSYGCKGVDTVLITEHPTPKPEIVGITALCSGKATVLKTSEQYDKYKWSTNKIADSIVVTVGGIYSVSVTTVDGCRGIDSVNVQVTASPTPVLVVPKDTYCKGETNTMSTSSMYANYQWSTGATTPTIQPNGTGTYSVTVSDANGCTGTTSKALTEIPSPTPQITGTLEFCAGLSKELDAGGGFTQYAWSNGPTTQKITVTNSGTYYVTVSNATGCKGYDTAQVVVHMNPEPEIDGIAAICAGEQTTLSVTGGNFNAVIWSTNSVDKSIIVSTGGNYSVTVTDGFGCSSSQQITVVESAKPTPTITGNTIICEGKSSVLDAGTGFNTYLWSTGATGKSITVTDAGLYSVTVTNAAGCSGITGVEIGKIPNPTVTITGDDEICAGESVTLEATKGYTAYQWSTGQSTESITAMQQQNYAVTVTDISGCTNTATFQLKVIPDINATMTVTPPNGCIGDTIRCTVAGGDQFTWTIDKGSLSDPTSKNPYFVLQEDVQLTAEVSNICFTKTVNKTIKAYTATGVGGADVNVLEGKTATLTASGGNNYSWFGPYPLSCNNCPNPKIVPAATCDYTVIITDVNGCVSLDTIHVEVLSDLDKILVIPNTITPNGDGKNDFLVIGGLESFDRNTLTIFNRWGDILYSNDNYDNSFNGQYKGGELPSGTYYYVLKVWPGEKVAKNVLIILRD